MSASCLATPRPLLLPSSVEATLCLVGDRLLPALKLGEQFCEGFRLWLAIDSVSPAQGRYLLADWAGFPVGVEFGTAVTVLAELIAIGANSFRTTVPVRFTDFHIFVGVTRGTYA